MRSISSIALFALTAAVTAQTTIVSPTGFDVLEGVANNNFPFNSNTVRRYMQIHADLGPTPLVITKLAFRVNASTTNYTGTRTHDIEVYMGEGTPNSHAVPNLTFDANYLFPKTTVLPRQLVTWGPTGQSVLPGPNPFSPVLEITLATPYVYTASGPLIWEVAYHGWTAAGTFSSLDADSSPVTTATSTITGTGCAATGSTALMTHTYTVHDSAGTLMMNGTVANAPPLSPVLMAIGFSNPNVAVPGLCGNLYTDGVAVQFLGLTSATGAFTADDPTGAIITPNAASGAAIFTQAFAFDASSALPLQFTVSNGRSSTVPTANTPDNLIARLWNNVGGTTATTAFFTTSIVGYGLIVQFTHL